MLNLRFIFQSSRARKGNDAENVRALKKGGIINKALWILNFLSYLRQSYLSEYNRDRLNVFITISIEVLSTLSSASTLLIIVRLSALHLLLVTFGVSPPPSSRPTLCTNCSAFHHLMVAARLPYLNRSADKIDVNRILSMTDPQDPFLLVFCHCWSANTS